MDTLRRLLLSQGILALTLVGTRASSGGYWDLQEFKRADVNASGSVSLDDAIVILNYLFIRTLEDLSCKDAADANDDGEVDVADSITILFFLFQGEILIPDPRDNCGMDQTEDWLTCEEFKPCGKPGKETASAGMELVYIPPGSFLMGSPVTERARRDDETLHEVIITRGFYMGATEVTQAQYKAVMGEYYDCGVCGIVCVTAVDYPSIAVCWDDAVKFCQRLSELEARPFRLPTEAEWEYACRAGTRTRFWFGDALDVPEGWGCPGVSTQYRDLFHCIFYDLRIRQRKPNPWGLYDIHDNATELCLDWYGPYPKGLVIDPQGPRKPTGRRVGRGDGSANGIVCGRSAARLPIKSGANCGKDWGCNPGFRVVLEVFPPSYPR